MQSTSTLAGRLLYYRGRHRLWFPGDWKLPQLNPITSRSHTLSGKRTWDIDEPRWLYRLRRYFAFAGAHRCRDRGVGHGTPDAWHFGIDGNRVCSYCGSIQFEDLMEICRKVPDDARYGVEGTDKNYKVYVRQPGVRNASEGAIKFYTWHGVQTPTPEDEMLFATACRLTHARFMAKFEKGNQP